MIEFYLSNKNRYLSDTGWSVNLDRKCQFECEEACIAWVGLNMYLLSADGCKHEISRENWIRGEHPLERVNRHEIWFVGWNILVWRKTLCWPASSSAGRPIKFRRALSVVELWGWTIQVHVLYLVAGLLSFTVRKFLASIINIESICGHIETLKWTPFPFWS